MDFCGEFSALVKEKAFTLSSGLHAKTYCVRLLRFFGGHEKNPMGPFVFWTEGQPLSREMAMACTQIASVYSLPSPAWVKVERLSSLPTLKRWMVSWLLGIRSGRQLVVLV